MTTTTPARVAKHAAATGPWTGTVTLIRLAVRRDRIRLSVWIAALVALTAYAPVAIELAYPDRAQRQARVDLLQTPAGIMLSGPSFGGDQTDLGAMVANELMLTLIAAAAILAILTVIRHTRADEESGVAELVMAAPIGRYARTAAALAVMGAANVALAILATAAMSATGSAVVDSAAMCTGVAATATVFGAVAAVTGQLWRQARAATGAAMATLAAAALVRGVGDVIDHSGSALSWLSPIAWAQQMRAFVDVRWWPLALLLALSTVLVALAATLESRRQYDSGTFAATGDRPGARGVRTVVGLHLVLQRGQLVGWAVGLLLAGLTLGSMTKALLDAAAGNGVIARVLGAQGTDGVHTTMTQFLAAAAGGYVTAAVLRVHADERSGLGEAVLAGAVSRWRWLGTAVTSAVLGATVLMLCAGVGNGLGAGLTTGDPVTVVRLAGAGLAYVPALAVLAGVAAVAVAVRRPSLGWLAVTFVVTALYLGALLRLPQWLIDLSPLTHTTAPRAVSPAAVIALCAVAVALTTAAGWWYRRRDAV